VTHVFYIKPGVAAIAARIGLLHRADRSAETQRVFLWINHRAHQFCASFADAVHFFSTR